MMDSGLQTHDNPAIKREIILFRLLGHYAHATKTKKTKQNIE